VPDAVLPVEPTVDEEAQPSYWFGLDVEPPVDPMLLESPPLGLVLGGSMRPLPCEDPRDLRLPLVHGEAMLLELVVHVVQQRTCLPFELGLSREADDPAAVVSIGDARWEFFEGGCQSQGEEDGCKEIGFP